MVAALAFIAPVAAAVYYANSTTTDLTTKYVTIPCPTATTLTYGGSTYTVTDATTLTVEDCSCTDNTLTKTVSKTDYVTIPCPTATTLTYGGSTYTVTQATTLTVEDCGCTDNHKVSAGPVTKTVSKTDYVQIPCPTSTTLTYGGSTYTISKATTLTVEDCSCTDNAKHSASTVTPASSQATSTAPGLASSTSASATPSLANAAPAAVQAGAAAGLMAAVAYLI